ncbi:unnamed protein product [Pelagomonas calceolata]|uniref:Uncharacterized protein n=1 Tax=Pelagomonas calceolata TaxID=35677 RepID=A0A8J2X4V0_9STRA|nr:unnamed protein product [Pelagomonas calceolata]
MRDAPPPRQTRQNSAAAKRSVPAGPVAHREHLEVEVDVRHVVHRPLGQREPDQLPRVGVLVADGPLVLGARHEDRVLLRALVGGRHDGVPREELALAGELVLHLLEPPARLLVDVLGDFAVAAGQGPRGAARPRGGCGEPRRPPCEGPHFSSRRRGGVDV